MRRIALIGLVLATSASAQPSEEDVKKAIIQMGTAHLCAPIMKDDRPFEWATKRLVDLVGKDRADELIGVMLAQNRDPGPLNEKMCRNMTKNYK